MESESLYTPAVREFILGRPWPKDKHGRNRVQMEVTEKYDPQPHLYLVFFRDNWLTLTVDEQLQVTSIVKDIMAKLWRDGIPTYTGKMESANA